MGFFVDFMWSSDGMESQKRAANLLLEDFESVAVAHVKLQQWLA
jgi:hypothetical protein